MITILTTIIYKFRANNDNNNDGDISDDVTKNTNMVGDESESAYNSANNDNGTDNSNGMDNGNGKNNDNSTDNSMDNGTDNDNGTVLKTAII